MRCCDVHNNLKVPHVVTCVCGDRRVSHVQRSHMHVEQVRGNYLRYAARGKCLMIALRPAPWRTGGCGGGHSSVYRQCKVLDVELVSIAFDFVPRHQLTECPLR